MKTVELHRMHARHLSALRRAPGTIEYYRVCLLRLQEHMSGVGLADLSDLGKPEMQGFVIWLRERGLSPGGEAAVMRGVRASLRWGFEEELLEVNPMARLRLASVPQARPPAVTSEIARDALKACAGTRHPLRDRGMLLVMLDTGVRMSELLQLRSEDLDVIGGFLRVRAETSKRQKERRIPLGVKAARAVTTYQRRERKPARAAVDVLFLNRSGQQMTPSGLHHVLIRLAETTGRTRAELAPHAWRRGFATSYLTNGGDIATLQLILGHSTLDQTRCYLRLSDDDLQRRHLRASPGDNL